VDTSRITPWYYLDSPTAASWACLADTPTIDSGVCRPPPRRRTLILQVAVYGEQINRLAHLESVPIELL
jgi:hypothetical protein